MKNKALKIVLFIGIFLILNFCAGWLMKGNMYNSFGRATLHDLHTKENIEVLFLGDSHLYAGLDVNAIEEKTGLGCITVATASQEPDGHYVILRETLKYHPELKQVYVDLDYMNNFEGEFKDRNHLRNIYTISDNLKDKKLKADYLLHATSPKYYLNHILLFGKNRISGNPKDAVTMLKSLITREYWSYAPPVSGEQHYIKNGYIPDYEVNTNYYFREYEQVIFNEFNVSNDWFKYVNKIIDFCKENNLELNFIEVCESDYKIYNATNYNDYYEFIKRIAESNNLNYYDFNLSVTLDLTYEDFYDAEHLNYNGSQKFTECLYNTIFKENYFSPFYESIEEKKNFQSERITGFNYIVSEDGKSITILPVQNKTYSINHYAYYLNDFDTPISEITQDNTITLPPSTNGKLLIKCFLNEQEYCTLEYNFNTEWIK